MVPKAALKIDGDTTRAFAIVDKHVEERLVQTGPAESEVVSILKGLLPGEKIVAHPSDQISDGVEVE